MRHNILPLAGDLCYIGETVRAWKCQGGVQMAVAFVRFPGLGEGSLEFGGTTRGRQWFDYWAEEGALETWFGKLHLSFTPMVHKRTVFLSVLTYLAMDALTTVVLGSRLFTPEPIEVLLWWLTRRAWNAYWPQS
jgi:hypothetical protein